MINPIIASLKRECEVLRKGGIPKPRMAILTPTYKCNQNCYYCFFKKKNNGDMIDTDKFCTFIKQIADFGIESIEYCGGGESLLLPNIEQVFKYAHSLGLRQGLLTNGVLFDGVIAQTFLKYGTYVRFSIDTIDKIKYKKIRGADDCDRVKMNIEKAIAIKQRHDHMCQISLKVGYAKELEMEDIQGVFDFAFNKRIYSIQLKNVWDENGNYYNNDLQKQDIYKIIKTHGTRFNKKIGAKKKMRERCWISPIQVTIDAYGDVYLCCYFQGREDSHKIGNLHKSNLQELWGSETHLKALRSTRINDCQKHDCRMIRYMDQWRQQEKSNDIYFV